MASGPPGSRPTGAASLPTNTAEPTFSLPHRPAPSIYEQNYQEVVAAYEKEDFDEVVRLARYNLTDPTLPRFYQIQNRILFCSAEADWYIAERCRIEAEQFYITAWNATGPGDEVALTALAALRRLLDQLEVSQGQDAPEVVDPRTLNDDWDMEDEDFDADADADMEEALEEDRALAEIDAQEERDLEALEGEETKRKQTTDQNQRNIAAARKTPSPETTPSIVVTAPASAPVEEEPFDPREWGAMAPDETAHAPM